MGSKQIIVYVMLVLGFNTALAQQQPSSVDAAQKLQSLLGGKKAEENIGKALAIGTLLGCTKKQAGAEATQAFYQDMTAVGKAVSGYCKEGHKAEARELVLTTLETHQNSPVYQAALACHDAQAANIASLGGQKLADNLALYASWAKDVPRARREITETDICKTKGNAS